MRDRRARRAIEFERHEVEEFFEDTPSVVNEKHESSARIEVISRAAMVLLQGAVLATDTHTAGPYTRPNGEQGWACIQNRSGKLLYAWQDWQELDPECEEHLRALRLTERVTVYRSEQDWSPFGAARQFVEAVDTKAAMTAIKRWKARQKARHDNAAQVAGAAMG